jgi:hypothetical protein
MVTKKEKGMKKHKKKSGTVLVFFVVAAVVFLYSCQLVSTVKETSKGGEEQASRVTPTAEE